MTGNVPAAQVRLRSRPDQDQEKNERRAS